MKNITWVMGFLVITALSGLSVAWAADVDLEILENGTVRKTDTVADFSDLTKLSVSVDDGNRMCKFMLSEPKEFDGRQYYCSSSLDQDCPGLAVIGSYGAFFQTETSPVQESVDGRWVSTGRQAQQRFKRGEGLTLELIRGEAISELQGDVLSVCARRATRVRVETSESGTGQHDTGFELVSYSPSSSVLEKLRKNVIGRVEVRFNR